MAFAAGQYESAMESAHEVVRLTPNEPQAYKMLGLIHEQLGDTKKALNSFILAALLAPKDVGEGSGHSPEGTWAVCVLFILVLEAPKSA